MDDYLCPIGWNVDLSKQNVNFGFRKKNHFCSTPTFKILCHKISAKMESENALSPIEPTAAPLPPTEAMDESTKTLPAPLELSKKSPAAPLEPCQKWLQPYCDSPKGLTAPLNQLRRSPTCDLLAVFFASFKAVYVKVVE